LIGTTKNKESSLKFKDLGQWGKSIGNINLYNGMFMELTPETWGNKKLRKITIKIIDDYVKRIKEQEYDK